MQRLSGVCLAAREFVATSPRFGHKNKQIRSPAGIFTARRHLRMPNNFDQSVRDGGLPPRQPPSLHEVTLALEAARRGDAGAADQLLEKVYEQLRELARSRMAREPGGGAGMTLDATALVHEA